MTDLNGVTLSALAEHPSYYRLLLKMADGAFYSGEQLGELMGVSRAAIWKQLQKVEALGVSLESKKGLGYRLSSPLQLLDLPSLLVQMSPQHKQHLTDCHYLLSTESTNKVVMDCAARGDNIRGLLVTAERQTAGRGRRGRQWYSPFAKNLYLSLGWTFEQGVAALEGLSLAVGVVVCESLEACGVPLVKLKWPNDILYDGRKLGGVLIELSGDPAGQCSAVVGVGLNVCMSQDDCADAGIDQPWIDVQSIYPNISRNRLLQELSGRLLSLLAGFESASFAAYRKRWCALNAHAHEPVCLIMGTKTVQGILVDIADNGGVVLDVAGEQHVFLGGEISLRSAL